METVDSRGVKPVSLERGDVAPDFDLPALIAAKEAAPARYGALAGRVGSTERYGAVLPKGSPLRPAINKAIASLRREGTFKRIGARHFGRALASTPVIR